MRQPEGFSVQLVATSLQSDESLLHILLLTPRRVTVGQRANAVALVRSGTFTHIFSMEMLKVVLERDWFWLLLEMAKTLEGSCRNFLFEKKREKISATGNRTFFLFIQNCRGLDYFLM